MEQLSFSTLIAVFEEMFGRGLFWSLVTLAIAFTLGFLYLVARDRGLKAGRFVRDEFFAIFGGIAAVLFVQMITSSGFSDLGGPVDIIVVAGIWIAGAVGTLITIYVIQGFIAPR
jgi:hypothetical protein